MRAPEELRPAAALIRDRAVHPLRIRLRTNKSRGTDYAAARQRISRSIGRKLNLDFRSWRQVCGREKVNAAHTHPNAARVDNS